jgi:hypothetical protein
VDGYQERRIPQKELREVIAMVNQNIKTNYTPKSKHYSKQIPANQQKQRDIRNEARKAQRPTEQYSSPIGPQRQTASEKIGKFLKRGAANFSANMHAPMFAPERPTKSKPRSHGRVGRRDMLEAEHAFIGNVREGRYPGYGGIDLSMHPDPMVSAMYRPQREEVTHRKSSKGGVTEIHYHYH